MKPAGNAVAFYRRPDGALMGYRAEGHTGYAEAGSDIVCAAVTSAVRLAECTINDVLHGGAVVAVGSNYMEEKVENNGTATEVYRCVGLHVAAVDTLGVVRWVANLRRNDMQKKSDSMLGVGLLPHADGVLLVKSERPKAPADPCDAKPAKEFEAGDKSNLVLCSIGDGGKAEKTVLESKTPQGFLRAVPRPDGAIGLFTADGRRLRQAELRMQ